ncbi:unnamed protein product [Arctia plantaginis]|uniref:Uncharacterized protein n=1 Tax=Arctia plantaginis TaxID=874455 RepID=A0A8S1ASB2_ARCPL|nr:unnamed protein product [Arctia plantaginis]
MREGSYGFHNNTRLVVTPLPVPCRSPARPPRGIDPVVPPPRTTPNQITGARASGKRAARRTAAANRDRLSLASLASESTLYWRA